jgi:hypothetical protein
MAERYNQAETVQEVVRPYKLAGRLYPLLSIYTRRRQHLQENTSEVREEPATLDFARLKQQGDASLDLYIILSSSRSNILSRRESVDKGSLT